MKVSHLNFSDSRGGAARAAFRIHLALKGIGVDSTLHVCEALTDDLNVVGPKSKYKKLINQIRPHFFNIASEIVFNKSFINQSLGIFPSNWSGIFNHSNSDIVNLHWISGEMISIRDVGKIRKPIVWTMHDMWAFCGTEHYTDKFNWRNGYEIKSQFIPFNLLDLNRINWLFKKMCWQKPMHIVAPSNWLANCVRDSALMSNWPVTVIPNCLDTELWAPINKKFARELLSLPSDKFLILFGAMGGFADQRKGFDLLVSALRKLKCETDQVEVVIFGNGRPTEPLPIKQTIHYVGQLNDNLSLRVLYSAADIMVVPSRLEAFGQTASEAHSCGTPVVAFDVGGLSDIVIHKVTGFLAKPFDCNQLAEGILWVLENNRDNKLGNQARTKAVENYSYEVIAKKYNDVYLSQI